jgi:hypothetical protein|tara:strand:+ start:363 stop:1022 length:660 start_codon:yes stop_codon:yes gene_type:complete
MQQQSESVAALAKALVATQGKLQGVAKSSQGYNYQYVDLAAVWDAIRKPLTANGLAVAQTTTYTASGEPVIVTTLLHTSGEWMRGELLVRPAKADPQSLGSAITYGRRYALMGVVGVAPADDDGVAASGAQDNTAAKPNSRPKKNAPANDATEKEARDHFRELFRKCVDEGGISPKDLATLNDNDSVEDIRVAYKKNKELLDAVTKAPPPLDPSQPELT